MRRTVYFDYEGGRRADAVQDQCLESVTLASLFNCGISDEPFATCQHTRAQAVLVWMWISKHRLIER